MVSDSSKVVKQMRAEGKGIARKKSYIYIYVYNQDMHSIFGKTSSMTIKIRMIL